MVLRPGEEAKLAPEAEQALLEQLRAEREAKAHVKLQADAQALAMGLAALELNDIPAKAKELASDKKKFTDSTAAAIAIMFNAVVRNGVPPKEDETATPRGGKKGGGGGGKKGPNAVKASAAKVVDRPPCTAAEARKAIKAHTHTLKEIATGPAAQLALLKAVESWLLSAHGATALKAAAAKVIEVLYDLDLATEDVLTKYWANVQAQASKRAADLDASTKKAGELEAAHELSLAAVQKAEAEQAELAYYKKNSEQYAQNVRCGNNPNKEEEAIEKAAIAQLKKAIELHTQSQKVLAARHKTLVADKAELESEQRALVEITNAVEHHSPFVTHSTPFFDWLAASDDEE